MLDKINACLEFVGAVLIWSNVWRLWRDKFVSGVNTYVTLYHSCLGLWFVNYYWQVGHYFSFGAQIIWALGNLVWVTLAVRYGKQKRTTI